MALHNYIYLKHSGEAVKDEKTGENTEIEKISRIHHYPARKGSQNELDPDFRLNIFTLQGENDNTHPVDNLNLNDEMKINHFKESLLTSFAGDVTSENTQHSKIEPTKTQANVSNDTQLLNTPQTENMAVSAGSDSSPKLKTKFKDSKYIIVDGKKKKLKSRFLKSKKIS